MDQPVNLQQLAYFREAVEQRLVQRGRQGAAPGAALALGADPPARGRARRAAVRARRARRRADRGRPRAAAARRARPGRGRRRRASRCAACATCARARPASARSRPPSTTCWPTSRRPSRDRYPGVRLRIVGLNSVGVADDVRAGRLEAGLVVLPVDAEGLVVRPALRDEVLYVSAQPHRVRRPRDRERAAATSADPHRREPRASRTRRACQIVARAQEAGVTTRADRRGRVPQRGPRAGSARRRRRARAVRRHAQPPLPAGPRHRVRFASASTTRSPS